MDHATSMQRIAALPPRPDDGDARDEWARIAGWAIAAAIVGQHYHDAAIDALPIFHPEEGWDRFLLTRRVSCHLCASVSADECGQLSLRGDDAPLLVRADGSVAVAFGPLLATDPEATLKALAEHLPIPAPPAGDHELCKHTRATDYPRLYGAIADLVRDYPLVDVLREIHVDEDFVDGTMHPLNLFTGGRAVGLTYDWWGLLAGDYAAFVHIDGRQSIIASETGNWTTVSKQLSDEDGTTITARLRGWLRLDAQPGDAAID